MTVLWIYLGFLAWTWAAVLVGYFAGYSRGKPISLWFKILGGPCIWLATLVAPSQRERREP
jgi:O-antigen/teichoic acid export membrane protein